MDPRRHLILRAAARLPACVVASLLLSGSAVLAGGGAPATPAARPTPPPLVSPPMLGGTLGPTAPTDRLTPREETALAEPSATGAQRNVAGASPPAHPAAQTSPSPRFTGMAPIPNPPEHTRRGSRRVKATSASEGRAAIIAANRLARSPSLAADFVGGQQVFHYAPGQVFEVWTAPLRVTTLTLAPGETVVSKAAGDTVRWQIGETTSGEAARQRAHVMIKPLHNDLETNLVVATNQRLYHLLLRSGPPDGFNTVVTWAIAGETERRETDSAPAPPGPSSPTTGGGKAEDEVAAPAAPTSASDGVARSSPPVDAILSPLDGRYRIAARGKPPAWTPTAVMTDGVRTFLAFPATLAHGEAPALFVRGDDGAPQLVNYRQQGGLWVVDRVVEQGELRLGSRPRDVVHFVRMGGAS